MDFQAICFTVMMVLVVVAGVVLALRGQRKTARFEQACRDRGWLVETETGGGSQHFVRGSTGGVNWIYEYYHHHLGTSGGEMRSGRLYVDSVYLPDDIVFITPRGVQVNPLTGTVESAMKLGGIGRAMVETMVTLGLGGDQADVDRFLALQPVETGSDALRQQFNVLATSENAAHLLLWQGETALFDFANNPAARGKLHYATVLLWSKGLLIPIEQPIDDANLLEILTNLLAGLAYSVSSRW